jgi:hypothetical protein
MMLAIDEELIKRVVNWDIIVKGDPGEILKSKYEDGWYVAANLRDSEELELERSGIQSNLSTSIGVKKKLPYTDFVNNDWYILEYGELSSR